jgi:hypothetical protein
MYQKIRVKNGAKHDKQPETNQAVRPPRYRAVEQSPCRAGKKILPIMNTAGTKRLISTAS